MFVHTYMCTARASATIKQKIVTSCHFHVISSSDAHFARHIVQS